jgi:hypothetical protein
MEVLHFGAGVLGFHNEDDTAFPLHFEYLDLEMCIIKDLFDGSSTVP